jgi:membrane protease YdiL (CAAX protease family)
MATDFPVLTDHIYIWIFGIILPFLSGLQSDQLAGNIIFNESSRKRLYLSNSLMLGLAGSSVLVLWLIKKRPMATLGFQSPDWTHYLQISLLTILLVALYATDLYLSKRKDHEDGEQAWYEKSSFLPAQWREMPSYILLCLCAGIFEEIIYRGFMVTYFANNATPESFSWVALLAPAALFSLAHFYQGWSSVLKIFLFTLFLNYLFLQTKSLFPTMVIHFLVDLVSGMTALPKKVNNQ